MNTALTSDRIATRLAKEFSYPEENISRILKEIDTAKESLQKGHDAYFET